MRGRQYLILLLALLSLPLSAQLPYRPVVDVDEACAVSCGSGVGTMTENTPTYEEQAVILDLVRAWVRMNVYQKRIPVFWSSFGLETYGTQPWMAPPSSPVAPYPWNPPVRYCSKRMLVQATLPGGGTGQFCATGVSYSDRIVISLVEPANVRALIAWEGCNNHIFWRLGLQQQPWPDGPMVAECAAFATKALGVTTTVQKKDVSVEAPPPPKKKEIPE